MASISQYISFIMDVLVRIDRKSHETHCVFRKLIVDSCLRLFLSSEIISCSLSEFILSMTQRYPCFIMYPSVLPWFMFSLGSSLQLVNVLLVVSKTRLSLVMCWEWRGVEIKHLSNALIAKPIYLLRRSTLRVPTLIVSYLVM